MQANNNRYAYSERVCSDMWGISSRWSRDTIVYREHSKVFTLAKRQTFESHTDRRHWKWKVNLNADCKSVGHWCRPYIIETLQLGASSKYNQCDAMPLVAIHLRIVCSLENARLTRMYGDIIMCFNWSLPTCPLPPQWSLISGSNSSVGVYLCLHGSHWHY